jgi:glycerophosphoryl diester phosphodiesterase
VAEAVRPLVIAHRGASGSSPENTLAAFRRAEALGAAMVELDVQLTRDGHVVVIHDLLLDRTTDGSGRVGDRSLDELRALDAGRWFAPAFVGERIPLLADVLNAVSLAVNVEVKAPVAEGLEARSLAVVEAAGALGRVVFSSFDPAVLGRLRALSSAATLAVLWEKSPIPMALRVAERVGARALHVRKDAATSETLAAAREVHLETRVWTVNDLEEFEEFARRGVDAVFTDFPERFLLNSMPGPPPSEGGGRRRSS